MNKLKSCIKRSPLFKLIKPVLKIVWQLKGRPVPPPHFVKQDAIKEYASKYSITNFVETGTFRGDMVYAVKDVFLKIYSVELDNGLYQNAVQFFSKYSHIKIIQGDSCEELPKILSNLKEATLFWLDGHYSGSGTALGKLQTPVVRELQIILSQLKNSVILVDDARCFNGTDDYPTIDEVKNMVSSLDQNLKLDIKDDIIRIYK